MRKTSSGPNTESTSALSSRLRGQVLAERLLDDDPPPPLGRALGHAGALHLLEHGREHRRRDRQVERGVAADAVGALELAQGRGQLVEGVVVVEGARHERDVGGQPLPDLLAPRRAGVLPRRLAGQLGELACRPSRGGRTRAARSWSAAARGWPGRRPPGSSFLRARSPVMPKTTRAHGSGTRGSRRSRGSRSGLGIIRPGVPPGSRSTAVRRSASAQLADPGGAVGQVQVQRRPAPVGEGLPVAGGLGRLQACRR